MLAITQSFIPHEETALGKNVCIHYLRCPRRSLIETSNRYLPFARFNFEGRGDIDRIDQKDADSSRLLLSYERVDG